MRKNLFSQLIFVFLLTLFSANAFSNTATTMVDDSVITAKIKSKILADKNLSVFKVDVSTHNGVVVLAGQVDSDSQAGQAIEIAQSTAGVKDIDISNLSIKESKQPISDTLITSKVKGMFIQEKLFSENNIAAMSIHVETNNGIVYLTGIADSQQQADNAVRIAKSVKGVQAVESNIKY